MNDGGSAFPKHPGSIDNEFGMSLRDYFAAKAMQGMLASGRKFYMPENKLSVERKSYELADAMLKERERK